MATNPINPFMNFNTGSTGQAAQQSLFNAPSYSYQQNFAGYTPEQRKSFYASPDFYNNPQAINSYLGQQGLTGGALLNDYNTVMGTNYTPGQAASWLTGTTPTQQAQWMSTAKPSQIMEQANYYGMGSNDLSSLYNSYYGTNVTPQQVSQYLLGTPTPTFNIPTNLFPYSQSSSSGGGTSSSFSGMNWQDPLAASILPNLQQQAAALPQMAEDVGTTSYNRYAKMLRDALGDKENFAGVFNSMAGRNMSGSSVASDALSNAMLGITQDIGNKAYESDVQALLAKMNVPQILAEIAQLGQISESQGSTYSSGSGSSANPLAPYQTIASMIESGY